MPILKNAIKKLRVDKRRVEVNKPVKARMKSAIKAAKLNPTKENLSAMASALDKAVKKGITKKNTAARTKSRVSARAKAKKA